MRLKQVQPYRSCRKSLDHLRDEGAVVQRLAHLLSGSGHQRVVHPVVRKALARGSRLRQLVLVMGKTKIKSAAVDIELIPQVFAAHCRALQIPPRPAWTPRCRPAGGSRLGVLMALP